jgi:hypothetical protein
VVVAAAVATVTDCHRFGLVTGRIVPVDCLTPPFPAGLGGDFSADGTSHEQSIL